MGSDHRVIQNIHRFVAAIVVDGKKGLANNVRHFFYLPSGILRTAIYVQKPISSFLFATVTNCSILTRKRRSAGMCVPYFAIMLFSFYNW